MQPDPPGKLVNEAVMAERRALRAERAEETLQQRAAAAERAVVSMEARLVTAEEKLAEAQAECVLLDSELLARERDARVASQIAFAEGKVREGLEGEIAELREHVEVLASEAEFLEGVADQARRAAASAQRRLADEQEAVEAAIAEAELVRRQVARRLDTAMETIADLRQELEDRIVAERGRAALALAREREQWEAALELERSRADGERAARHRAEAELGARRRAGSPPLPEIRAFDRRSAARSAPPSGEPAVAVAQTVIADLARAAERLREQVESRPEPEGQPAARRRRRRWWLAPWRRPPLPQSGQGTRIAP